MKSQSHLENIFFKVTKKTWKYPKIKKKWSISQNTFLWNWNWNVWWWILIFVVRPFVNFAKWYQLTSHQIPENNWRKSWEKVEKNWQICIIASFYWRENETIYVSLICYKQIVQWDKFRHALINLNLKIKGRNATFLQRVKILRDLSAMECPDLEGRSQKVVFN